MICKLALLLSFVFLGAACASGVILENTHSKNLEELRQSIANIAGPPKRVSENRREITSVFFSRKKDSNFDPEKAKERLYAKFIILGDRRPYEVSVQVFYEQKVDGRFEDMGEDEAMSEKIAGELRKELARRPEERNVIDDFRAF